MEHQDSIKWKFNMWELETETGIYFWGSILSNWTKSPFSARLVPDGDLLNFNTSEQYMMRTKAELFGDQDTGKLIMETTSPRDQKRLGRSIQGYSDTVWDPAARDMSYVGIYQKFAQNFSMKDSLLGTGNKLIVEASPLDVKWGVGLDHLDLRIFDKRQWRGTNWLGQILMKVRDDLRDGVSSEFTKIDWNQYS